MIILIFPILAALCKSRWTNLRDQYRKSLKKKETVSGQAAKKMKKYKYEDQLSFLRPYFQERDTISNINYEESNTDDEGLGNVENGQNESFEVNVVDKPDITEDDTAIVLQTSAVNRSTSGKIKKRCEEKPVESASSILMKYFIKENEKELKENSPSADPVDSFLNGIGVTMKTFTPFYLNLAKSKIFSIVQDIDMQQIMENQKPETNSYNNHTPATSLFQMSGHPSGSSSQINNSLYQNLLSTPLSSSYPIHANYSTAILNTEGTPKLPIDINQENQTLFYSNINPQK